MNTQTISLLKATKNANTNSVNVENHTTVNNQKKTFIAAELWNIQRHGRTLLGRRRCA
ncbi:hypothetical protein LK994_05330 [Ferruginibacter lapsinanis]|uniref:hypothetical protein n=1 Tax=Ferruginibacter lapsinanis TaxID=563172 RepID=UPI001E505C7F|nr:hypothetical protein [Ferruginibacter lapsinanis]UEG50894.1 hypothetical protein LK994_05330 [Ferruginibacter lapsinanis]